MTPETAVVVRDEPELAVMLPQADPGALMRRATDVAGVCREIVLRTASTIQGRKFVRVEGWQAIATAHGCVLSIESVEQDGEGNVCVWAACRRTDNGVIIAKAQGWVGADETTWSKRAVYARRAMAQTRAMSRVGRSAFAHVVVLIDANLSTTPAEEVPDDGFEDNHAKRPAERPKPVTAPTQPQAPKTAPSAKPASPWPISGPEFTAKLERCKAKLFTMSTSDEMQAWLAYAIDRAWILPNESLEAANVETIFECPSDPRFFESAEECDDHIAEMAKRHKLAVIGQTEPVKLSNPTPASRAKSMSEAVAQNDLPKQKTLCPHCNATTGRDNAQLIGISVCDTCGWQWDEDGYYFEEHPWQKVICPVPHKGEKKIDYDKDPMTLGRMQRVENNRAFGFIQGYKAEGWQGRPPRDSDLAFERACAEAKAHIEKRNTGQAGSEENEVPF